MFSTTVGFFSVCFATLLCTILVEANEPATCNGFFTVLAELEPWKSHGQEHCESTFYKMDYSFRSLSHQMRQMGTVLKIYTSYSPRPTCTAPYPGLELVHFNATELMQEYDMQGVIDKFAPYTLGEQNYARVSDMLRILLAHKHGGAYMDLDVHYLNYDRAHFARPFVASHIWAPVRCSVEITNAAFCLPPAALLDLRDHMVARIVFGSDLYLYTELGPLMFTKVLMNRHPVTYYSVNHPEEHRVAEIVEGIRAYNHSLLHLTSSLRLLLHRDETTTHSFEELVDMVRAELGLAPLKLPPSVLREENYALAVRAMYLNHPSIDHAEGWYPQLYKQWRALAGDRGQREGSGEAEEVLRELLGVLRVVMGNTAADNDAHVRARALWDEIIGDEGAPPLVGASAKGTKRAAKGKYGGGAAVKGGGEVEIDIGADGEQSVRRGDSKAKSTSKSKASSKSKSKAKANVKAKKTKKAKGADLKSNGMNNKRKSKKR